jgi:U4/U6.U5 tri-snRNP-associated protein 1
MSDNIPKAVVTESNGEISCSVEETNRIRALLGLKPLRGVGANNGGGGAASGDVKATVTESNGEISCSIEETNRIRALLGLKPLKLDGSAGSSNVLNQEARSVENFHKQKEEEQRAKEEQELRERIEDAKARRYVQAKFEGRGLGEVGGDADETKLLSAAEWASRSRAKEQAERERKKREAEEAARRLDEEERLLLAGGGAGGRKPAYSSSDLRGLQVQHGAEDFNVGETIILTLADTAILRRNEHGKVVGVNEEVDVLENVNMTEEERRKLNEKIKKRAKMPVYSGYDDAEFAEGATPGSRPSILSHYDKEATLRPKMVLEAGGQIVTSTAVEDALSGGVKFDVAELKRLDETLGSESKTMSDYLTPAEYASFNKPKKEKKMRKIRKKEREESSFAELLEAAQEENAVDRGSRNRSAAGGVAATVAVTDSQRRDAYNLALQKAQNVSDRVYSETAKKYTKPVVEEVGDDDDLQVALALSRAKNIANQLSAKERAGVEAESKDDSDGFGVGRTDVTAIAIKNAVGDEAAALLVQKKMPRVTVKASSAEGVFDIDAEGRTTDGTLVFSDTTEFTSRLQARLNERVRDQADSAVRELASRKRAAEEDEALEGMMDVDESAEESDAEQEEDYDEQLGLLQQKPIASKGLAATLALLKSSGDLKTREELAGRTKDVRDIDPSSNEFGVKLEYRDEFGRKLTQKEAFRQLSYKFHGFGPQQKKQEKRLKALVASSKAASSKGSIDAGTMKSLVKAQEATGKAHVTIQVNYALGLSMN